ncbi:unnamed protein product [Sphagnum balticum]
MGKKLRGSALGAADELVHVETLPIADPPLLLFTVRDRALATEQAAGTNGIPASSQDSSSSYPRKHLFSSRNSGSWIYSRRGLSLRECPSQSSSSAGRVTPYECRTIRGSLLLNQVYIEREKERLKGENMEKQLANFSRNKKKMAPYDIKPTPNPRIDPNLHFFLNDPHAQPPPEASIKIQTDEFQPRAPPAPYRPKKTGVNTATQIEQD